MLREQASYGRQGRQMDPQPCGKGLLVINLEHTTLWAPTWAPTWGLLLHLLKIKKKILPHVAKSEFFVVKEQNKDLIRLENPAEWYVYRKSVF